MQPERKLPAHIAIVMDGNGRWAEQRSRPRTMGHQAGLKALRRIVAHCGKRGIPELTVFAFSSENWNRPQNEVSRLMDLFMRALDKEVTELHENAVQVAFIGELEIFAPDLQQRIQRAVALTRSNTRMRLNVAVNYGGRWDIVQAARSLAEKVAQGAIQPQSIDEAMFRQHLMLASRPDPDLFIRTGGEQRISNFLLWQCAYTEFYFSPQLWPDFTPQCLDQAMEDFALRERRFGRIGKQTRRSDARVSQAC